MAKLLFVEDDAASAKMTSAWLEDENYIVEWAASGDRALDILAVETFDVILLDWDIPKVSGMDVLKELRNKGDMTPVIMLTGHKTSQDKEQGLDCGADDYLVKPYDPVELSARIRVQLRRTAGTVSNILKVKDITLDAREFRVTCGGKPVDLLPKEFALLEFFMRNPDRVFSAEAVMHRVWRTEDENSTNAFRSCLKRLRAKLESDGEVIETIHGLGYRLSSK